MQRKPQRNPVTPEVREQVMFRDMNQWVNSKPLFEHLRNQQATRIGCIAAMLAPATSGPCSGPLTLDHVKDSPMMGKRAPSDPQHLVTICLGHHVETPWATSNRPLLRWYLKRVNGANA